MPYKTHEQWKGDLDLNIDANGTQAITGTILNSNQTDQGDSIYWGEHRVGNGIPVVAAGTNILFGTAFANNANFALHISCYDAQGNNVDFQRLNVTLSGFRVVPAVDAFVDYSANA